MRSIVRAAPIRSADERSGAASCLIGIAANRCSETAQLARIDSLVTGLERPDLPPMLRHSDPVPMPHRTNQVRCPRPQPIRSP